jgi:hypothetical protein
VFRRREYLGRYRFWYSHLRFRLQSRSVCASFMVPATYGSSLVRLSVRFGFHDEFGHFQELMSSGCISPVRVYLSSVPALVDGSTSRNNGWRHFHLCDLLAIMVRYACFRRREYLSRSFVVHSSPVYGVAIRAFMVHAGYGLHRLLLVWPPVYIAIFLMRLPGPRDSGSPNP